MDFGVDSSVIAQCEIKAGGRLPQTSIEHKVGKVVRKQKVPVLHN